MWFEESVFYQLYPLTLCGAPAVNAPVFGCASTGDGRGTGHFLNSSSGHTSSRAAGVVPGGIGRLEVFAPHLQELGIGGVYLNPIFESDSHGYDTRDYRVLDRRLGTNAEFRKVVDLYHSCGIRVVLDGVFNHVGRGFFAFRDVQEKKQASPYKDWFRIDFGGDTPFHDGFWYEAWEGHYELVKLNLDNPAVQQYLMESIDLWFREFDIDGIRLDVAYLLPLWFIAMIKDRIRALKPDAFLLGEILGDNAGRFYDQGHVDAITDYPGYKGLWSSFNSFNLFELAHTIKRNYGEMYRGRQLFSFADNHDVERIASKLTDPEKLPLVYALLFTLPGVPFLYYGDEIGMHYLDYLPTKEGGYTRTGSRTPMQWAPGKNLGFSQAAPEKLYLPVDPAPDAPTVSGQEGDPASILNTVKAVLALRHGHPDLQADGSFEVLHAKKGDPLLIYRRGSLTLAVNPSDKPVPTGLSGRPMFEIGAFEGGVLGPRSFAVLGA